MAIKIDETTLAFIKLMQADYEQEDARGAYQCLLIIRDRMMRETDYEAKKWEETYECNKDYFPGVWV